VLEELNGSSFKSSRIKRHRRLLRIQEKIKWQYRVSLISALFLRLPRNLPFL
jgi:hypothetical protein